MQRPSIRFQTIEGEQGGPASCALQSARSRVTHNAGLYRAVSPDRPKRWFRNYDVDGKEKRLAVGNDNEPAPAKVVVSLKAARVARVRRLMAPTRALGPADDVPVSAVVGVKPVCTGYLPLDALSGAAEPAQRGVCSSTTYCVAKLFVFPAQNLRI